MDESSQHLDPTYEISLETVKKRTLSGVLTLTGRTFILNFISLASQGLLWAFLTPGEFGTFFLVSATVNFLSYFADIGLGAALIQKKEIPTQEDYKTVFSVQEILVFTVSAVLLVVSPLLARSNSLSHQGIGLLYALIVAFILASFKNIPSIILERKMEFSKYVIPTVIEQVVYNIFVVYFAWRGFGISSFSYAVIIRGITGVVAIYLLQPWRPGFLISKKSVKSLLKFGIPYQLNNFLATLKDDGLTVVLGGILGQTGLGIFGTAQKLAQYPLRFFMDNVTKVTFPAFSRMQDKTVELSRLVTRSIFFISFLTYPSLVGLIVLYSDILEVIPKYQKWQMAFVPLIFLSINSFWAAFTTQLTNLLNSVGRIKTTFKFMIMWTILTWLLVPFLSYKFGIIGASIAYALIGTSSLAVFMVVKRVIKWSFTDAVVKPLLSSLMMGLFLEILRLFTHPSIATLVVFIILGCLFYLACSYLIVGKHLFIDMGRTLREFISSHKKNIRV